MGQSSQRCGLHGKHDGRPRCDTDQDEHGVPDRLFSCHTAIVDGYVVEGHVPAEDIKQLLAERPDVTGIAVPGMPQGSPGMEGPNPVEFPVVAFDKDGEMEVINVHTP